MFSPALLLFSLASIFQYVLPSNDTLQLIYEPHEKIVVSDDSTELTYHVLLQNRTNLIFFCAGSAINPLFVLTAAECVVSRESEDIRVVANFKDLDQAHPFYLRLVTKIFVHKNYNPLKPWRNDIALLRLNGYFPYIRTAFVPNKSERRFIARMARPIPATVSGFGIISENQPPTSRQMLKSYTYIYEWTYCKKLFKKLRYSISKSHICAYDPYNHENINESRTSDVGSPLVYSLNLVVGIALSANWGLRLNNTQYPLLFTNITLYRKWIKNQIGTSPSRDPC